MSLELVGRVLDHSSHKGSAKLLLVAIAYHANKDSGECYLGRKRLARYLGDMGGDERYTRRLIDRLVESGELRRQVGAGPGGANRYAILLGGGSGTPGAQKPPGLGVPKEGAQEPLKPLRTSREEEREAPPPIYELQFTQFYKRDATSEERKKLAEAAAIVGNDEMTTIIRWSVEQASKPGANTILSAARKWQKGIPPNGNYRQSNRQPTKLHPDSTSDPERAAKDRELSERARKQRAERKQRG